MRLYFLFMVLTYLHSIICNCVFYQKYILATKKVQEIWKYNIICSNYHALRYEILWRDDKIIISLPMHLSTLRTSYLYNINTPFKNRIHYLTGDGSGSLLQWLMMLKPSLYIYIKNQF
jgi:hypothetical protein